MKRILLLIFAVALIMTMPAAAQVDSVGLRLIVVKTEGEANDLLARLKAGEPFPDLARKHSTDSSASAGGYLGTVVIPQLRKEFQDALAGVMPGETSPIARIGREYALLHVLTDEETGGIELKTWLDAGADIHSPAVDKLWGMAVNANRTDLITALLAAKADVNARLVDGSTVLMGAAYAGHIDMVRQLLSGGANVNAALPDGSTILMKAALAGHTDIVRALIDARAPVNSAAKNGLTALMQAAFSGHLDTSRILLEAGANVHAVLDNGSSALMAASQAGKTEVVRALLTAGARVNDKAKNGSTALMESAYAGHIDTVRALLSAKADVNTSVANGLTALMAAALGGHTEIAAALLEAGANAGAKDSKGWTALTHAQASANSGTVKLVLAASPNVSPQERSTILGRTYANEYYSSQESSELELAAAEFQKVLAVDPGNLAALEWMGALEVLRWNNDPSPEEFSRAANFLKKAVNLDPKDPDRHYWIAATNWIFASRGKGAAPEQVLAIVDEGIEHARTAISLDPLFANAMEYLSLLYRLKADRAAASTEREQLLKTADTAYQDALKVRRERGNAPSRFNDQFTRPAAPPPPSTR